MFKQIHNNNIDKEIDKKIDKLRNMHTIEQQDTSGNKHSINDIKFKKCNIKDLKIDNFYDKKLENFYDRKLENFYDRKIKEERIVRPKSTNKLHEDKQ